MIDISGKIVECTSDYEVFQRLSGNRAVLSSRVNKIIKSIQKNGYIPNPIIVNEKYEVIDGQGRLEALKQLKLPVFYIVIEGLGRDECVALNAYSTTWNVSDYINAYCEDGNENYIRMRDVIDEFPEIGIDIKLMMLTGLASTPHEAIKAGTVKVTEDQMKKAEENLCYAQRFMGTFSRIKGTKSYYIYAVVFAKQCGVDVNRLMRKIEESVLNPLRE